MIIINLLDFMLFYLQNNMENSYIEKTKQKSDTCCTEKEFV